MSFKDFQNELYTIGNKLWLKLQRLPTAEPVEILFFFVIILFIVLQGLAMMSTSMQTASQVLKDLKTRILTDDWALGGLVVMVSFCTVIIALLLFAAIFGCCSTPRKKSGSA